STTTEQTNSAKVPVWMLVTWFPFVIERGASVRSILVCVKTPHSAQAVATAATRLGLGGLIATAIGGAQARAGVADGPPEVLLVDTSAVRPDPVGFTREVLRRAPDAVVIFLGPEEPVLAQGAVDAGARGLIRGGDREDLVATVAKTL